MTAEEAFARFAAERGIDLRAFDAFIAQVPPGDDRDAFAEARAEGVAAMAQGNEDWARRCLLWMLAANRLWLAFPKARRGEDYSNAQSDKAKKPRGRIHMADEPTTKAKVVAALVAQNPEATAKELWPALYGALDLLGLSPVAEDSAPDKWRYRYDGGAISFGAFQDYITDARKKSG